MEDNERDTAHRLEAAAAAIELALARLDERIAAAEALSGNIDRITATVEVAAATRRESELTEKLAAAEREIRELKDGTTAPPLNVIRRTVPAATSEMLAKHGIGEGPVDVRTLDAALTGLSLEQRIAVKSQLLRSGAIA